MPLKRFIKEVGRGASGARSLSADDAASAFGVLLDAEAPELQMGAFLLAMRVKGETLDELIGFLAATQARCVDIPSTSPLVLLPSYNGARRLPNLTALLAMALAQDGVRVLVHGLAHDPHRVTTAAVMQAMGLPACDGLPAIQSRWARRQPAFVETGLLCPGLQRLLDVRWSVGLRNSAHTIAKMLLPVSGAPALRVVNTTHPEFARLMADWAERSGANALLLRGTEGEPVADARRRPGLETWIGGRRVPELCLASQEGSLSGLPLLPRAHDAATTAQYIQAVLAGETPMPDPIALQSAVLRKALQAMAAPFPAEPAG